MYHKSSSISYDPRNSQHPLQNEHQNMTVGNVQHAYAKMLSLADQTNFGTTPGGPNVPYDPLVRHMPTPMDIDIPAEGNVLNQLNQLNVALARQGIS